MRGIPLLILVVLLTLALVPPSNAQGTSPTTVETSTTVRVFDPGDPLPPGRTSTLVVAVRYQYGQGARADQPTQVDLQVNRSPPWATAKLLNTTVTFPVPATSFTSGRTDERRVELNLTVDPDAPAFHPGNLTVHARAHGNGNLAPSEDQDTQAVEPDYSAVLTVDAPRELVVDGGREEVLRFTVTNTANAPTRVLPHLQAKPQNSLVTLPGPFSLASTVSNGTGPTETITTVHLRTPWTSGEEGTLTLELQPVHAERDEALGSLRAVSVQILGQSVVPGAGLGAFLLAAGLAGALLPARRLRG